MGGANNWLEVSINSANFPTLFISGQFVHKYHRSVKQAQSALLHSDPDATVVRSASVSSQLHVLVRLGHEGEDREGGDERRGPAGAGG